MRCIDFLVRWERASSARLCKLAASREDCPQWSAWLIMFRYVFRVFLLLIYCWCSWSDHVSKSICYVFNLGATSPWPSHSIWPWVALPQALQAQGKRRRRRTWAAPSASWSTCLTALSRWTTRWVWKPMHIPEAPLKQPIICLFLFIFAFVSNLQHICQ